jgi:hypothetical protein
VLTKRPADENHRVPPCYGRGGGATYLCMWEELSRTTASRCNFRTEVYVVSYFSSFSFDSFALWSFMCRVERVPLSEMNCYCTRREILWVTNYISSVYSTVLHCVVLASTLISQIFSFQCMLIMFICFKNKQEWCPWIWAGVWDLTFSLR